MRASIIVPMWDEESMDDTNKGVVLFSINNRKSKVCQSCSILLASSLLAVED